MIKLTGYKLVCITQKATSADIIDTVCTLHTDFLGCTKLSLKDLLRSGDSPWNKRLLLEEVSNGEIELAIELELKKSGLLL